MNALTFETVVTAERQVHLPDEWPVGCRVRVTVEPIEQAEKPGTGTAIPPRSELGRTLLAIRECAIARGLALQPVDDILEEIRQDRGGPLC
jgi:hypothetical protein